MKSLRYWGFAILYVTTLVSLWTPIGKLIEWIIANRWMVGAYAIIYRDSTRCRVIHLGEAVIGAKRSMKEVVPNGPVQIHRTSAFVSGEHQRSRWDRKRRGRSSRRLIEAALVLATTVVAAAQVAAPPPALPSNWVGLGAAYGPPTTGWASYARAVSAKQGIYSYTTYDVTLSKTRQIQTSTRTGLGIVLRQVALGSLVVSVLALGDVGVVTGAANPPATGSTAATAYGGSGGLLVQKKGSPWTAAVFVRRLQLSTGLQTVYEGGVGYAW